MAMIPGVNVDIDFTNPEIYTDEYAEENADTEEFKFIKETPLYKDVRKSLSLNISFDDVLVIILSIRIAHSPSLSSKDMYTPLSPC